jgi:hypothetical protein
VCALSILPTSNGVRLAIRRGNRAEVFSRSPSPWNLARPSDILVAERSPAGSGIAGFLQSASIGAGFLFLADELELAQLQADDEQTRRELAAQAVRRLPVGKRLWWLGSATSECVDTLQACDFETISLAESAKALWPALAFFGTPIFLLPSLIFAFPFLPQGLELMQDATPSARAALAVAPPVLTSLFAVAALAGKTVLRAEGRRTGR